MICTQLLPKVECDWPAALKRRTFETWHNVLQPKLHELGYIQYESVIYNFELVDHR